MTRTPADRLGQGLPDRFMKLSELITRKPTNFTSDFADNPIDSFKKYTNTSTVNLIHSWNECLLESEWPIPAYLPIKRLLSSFATPKRYPNFLKYPFFRYPLNCIAPGPAYDSPHWFPLKHPLVGCFLKHRQQVFAFWRSHDILRDHENIIDEIEKSFTSRTWLSNILATYSLLDVIIRDIFQSDSLRLTVGTMREGFFHFAKLKTMHLKPGYGVWESERVNLSNRLFSNVEKDLRLPGVYLTSFFHFSDRFFSKFDTQSDKIPNPINRHAMIHGASTNYQTQCNAVKLISFADLTLRIAPILRFLTNGDVTLLTDSILTKRCT